MKGQIKIVAEIDARDWVQWALFKAVFYPTVWLVKLVTLPLRLMIKWFL